MIHAASWDDLDAILSMMEDWVAEDITWGQQVTARDYLESRIGRHFLVAENKSKIVGYAFGNIVTSPLAVFQYGPYMNIEEIYVIPVERGCGIVSTLLKTLMKSAKKEGINQFYVFSGNKDQDRIVEFYERHRFQIWGTQLFRKT
ncbi:MAG: N-acetyltransferase family protein [Promethearchaeota archaeon]|jgi:N-acetylglutamate synthase-like GNAT family acetyltransferase